MPTSELPIDVLIQQLHGADWIARCEAARLLGQSRDPRALDALLPDLNDPDWRVRRNAAQALGALRDKRAVEPLLSTLKDRTMTVRQRTIVALGRIKDPQALPALLEILLQNRHESYDAAKAVRKFGKKALPEITKAFERTNDEQLMLLLIELKYEGALDLLLKRLASQEASAHLRAVRELGNLGNKKAIPHLIEQLNSSNSEFQSEIVRALGKLGAAETAPALLHLLTDDELYGPRSDLYQAVTETFQAFGGLSEEIKNAFPGKYPAMFNIGGASISLPQALGLLGNDQPSMLQEVLSRPQSRPPEQVEAPGLPPELINKIFEDMTWKFGVMFQDARDASQERVKRLRELLKSESSLTRCAAALSLPWYADEESLEQLESTTRDPDDMVRKAATWAGKALQKVILYRRQGGL